MRATKKISDVAMIDVGVVRTLRTRMWELSVVRDAPVKLVDGAR